MGFLIIINWMILKEGFEKELIKIYLIYIFLVE